ncbi:maltose alpha-D-glucosyltransferase [Desulfovibrio sp. TomC]|uniref:maltose alpha-D-glucosyltransferase n=1 Tax=Desulfovibrio sp. TomC TaxID=1562888 RepID=UPI0005735CC8|nr:maltose alpha-D-glucosyltransferase [Desulfovibrio sp. TomC]KHK00883.1 Trehalose synthase [Desulfovibrio sp. TomC]
MWYKETIVYELHVRSFADGDGDGVGDFKGLIDKLDYLERLGVGALWLQPFYPSPLRDDGYDIADYCNIHPAYGTLPDFKRFLREAHKRGLRVITELVLNHTSDQHPWFQRARRAKPGSPARDFYVWNDTPDKYRQTRIIFKDFENSNWAWDPVAKAYYWHRFYANQPDLNFDNPAVRQAMLKVVDFWLGMGVDGLRLDAVPYLFERQGTNCENLPETHGFLKELRAHVDASYPDRMLLAEANQWPEDAVAYFGAGDECHMAFHFPIMPRIFMALWAEDRYPVIDILKQTPAIPESCQWALFLRNHDELTLEMVSDEERDSMYRAYARDTRARINLGIRRRLAPLMQNNRRKMELINILLLSFPGTPILYYGDELGMGDNYHLGDRNGVRTPMQWTPDRNAGFSKANPQSLFLPLIIDPEYHYELVNVETLERNPSSFLWWTRRLLAAYKSEPALGRGDLRFVGGENTKVLALLRTDGGHRLLAVINLSRHAQATELDLADLAGYTPVDVFGQARFPTIGRTPYVLTLGGYDYFWFRLENGYSAKEDAPSGPLRLTGRVAQTICAQEGLSLPGGDILPPQLTHSLSRLIGGEVDEIRQLDELVLHTPNRTTSLLLAESQQQQGDLTTLFLLASRTRAGDQGVGELADEAILAELECPQGVTTVLRGLLDPASVAALAGLIAAGKRRRGASGVFLCDNYSHKIDPAAPEQAPTVRLLTRKHQSMTFSLDNTVFLKVFLRPEEGVNPELELPLHLARQGVAGIPRVLGSLAYRRPHGQDMVLAVASSYVSGAVAGDSFALESLERFFGEILALGQLPSDKHEAEAVEGSLLEFFRSLGEQTARLHLALAAVPDPDFTPEPVTKLYLRSIYQSMRNQLHRASLAVDAARRDAKHLKPLPKRTLLEKLSPLLTLTPVGARLRIHGDFQLENILRVGQELVVTDFDGDVRLPLGERRIKRSPLRDVASLLLSVAMVARRGYARHIEQTPSDGPLLAGWLEGWIAAACDSFLSAYLETTREAAFLPADPVTRQTLLEIFVIEQGLRTILRGSDEHRLADVPLVLAALGSLKGLLP